MGNNQPCSISSFKLCPKADAAANAGGHSAAAARPAGGKHPVWATSTFRIKVEKKEALALASVEFVLGCC